MALDVSSYIMNQSLTGNLNLVNFWVDISLRNIYIKIVNSKEDYDQKGSIEEEIMSLEMLNTVLMLDTGKRG